MIAGPSILSTWIWYSFVSSHCQSDSPPGPKPPLGNETFPLTRQMWLTWLLTAILFPILFWSALVNIRRKALLSSVGFRKPMTSRSPRSSICDSSALRSSISELFDFWWEIIPRLIPINSNKKMPLPSFRGCFDVSSLSAGKRTFQWMLLNNILWMAPDHQAVYLGDNYTLSLSLLDTCTV